jgi:GntR family transcriptional regulator of vanillate catabolism
MATSQERLETVSQSRSESVVIQLRDMIMRGEFATGFHLQEIPLAEQIGVSRTPIREALIILAKEGLLEPGPKRGYKVRTFSIEEVIEAYDVRATLEGMACRVIAERGLSDDDARTLQNCVELGDEMLGRGMFGEAELNTWVEMNNTFHTILVRATRNAMLEGFIDRTQQVPLASARHVAVYKHDQQNFEQTKGAQEFHRGIVNAIMRRQSGRAEHLMREHIYTAQELVRKYFKDQNVGFDFDKARGTKL